MFSIIIFIIMLYYEFICGTENCAKRCGENPLKVDAIDVHVGQ